MLATVNVTHRLASNTTLMPSLKPLFVLLAVSGVSLLTGCSSMEQKLGRGISNAYEPIRMGEIRRSYEQTYLADGAMAANTTGVVHGVARTLQRTVVGVFDIVTFPIPTDPLIKPEYPVLPDSQSQAPIGSFGVGSDQYLGFQDSAVLPFSPGSEFSVSTN